MREINDKINLLKLFGCYFYMLTNMKKNSPYNAKQPFSSVQASPLRFILPYWQVGLTTKTGAQQREISAKIPRNER
jgi:hypothetical protein